jgi:hypothetical protein
MSDGLNSAFNSILGMMGRSVTIERLGGSELVSGAIPATSITLISNISSGVAYILGIRIVIPTTSHTYTASSDTYFDIAPVGTLVFTTVANGAVAPAIATNHLRISKVVTNATAIITATMLRTPKELYAIVATAIKLSPSNYSRLLASPEETVVTGREFVVSKNILDAVFFPNIKRGDRIIDPQLGANTVTDVKEMHGLGGIIMGYRIRTS